MELGISGKTALVGGGSKGLGFACAKALALEGVNVVICSRTRKNLIKAKEKIESLGKGKVVIIQGDLKKTEDVDRWINTCIDKFGRVDILINNQGGPPPGTFEDTDEEAFDDAYKLVFKHVLHSMKRVIPIMKKQKWGRIINIVSITVKEPLPDIILSNTMRASVVALAKTLSKEVAQYGITVNNIAPGPFETERLKSLWRKTAEKEGITFSQVKKRYISQIPVGKTGNPDELGALAAFLCSNKASYITGTTILIDGGTSRVY